jgi:hypothetical protein
MVSVYPVIKIWQLNENSEQLDLASGGDYLKILAELTLLLSQDKQQVPKELRVLDIHFQTNIAHLKTKKATPNPNYQTL